MAKSQYRPLLEELESREMLATPSVFPGTPISLPQDGAWAASPFVASPIFADLDNNGTDELITAVSGGRLRAYRGTPTSWSLYKEYRAPTQKNFKSTPIVVTMPNGRKALFAGLGRDEGVPGDLGDGRVFGWDATTTNLLPGWPRDTGRNIGGESGITGALTSGDLNGDGQPEIIATSFSHFVTAFNLSGGVLWRYEAGDTILSGAVVGDVDKDGKPEVVFGSDASQGPYFHNGGFVNILNNNGSAKFRHDVSEVIWSSPVLADLNNNGTLEIIVGTGLNFDLRGVPGARAAGNRVLALDFTGHPLPGWPYRTTTNDGLARQTYPSPAIADINGDGRLDVIAVDRGGFLHVIGTDGKPLPGWVGGRQISRQSAAGDTYASPIVADVDGSGTPDIIAAANGYLVAFNPQGTKICELNALGRDVCKQDSFPGEIRWNAAAVGQFDGQGGLELAAVSMGVPDPKRPLRATVFRLPSSNLTPPWPMLRRSAAGVARLHSTTFLRNYVIAAHRGLLNRYPTTAGLNHNVNQLVSNQLDLFPFARILASSAEARGKTVDKLFDRYLDRAPSAEERADRVAQLSRSTVRDVAVQFINSPEFSRLAGNTTDGKIRRLFQTVLFREPTTTELNNARTRLQTVSFATYAKEVLVSLEAVTKEVSPIYKNAFGTSTSPTAETLRNLVYDARRNQREESMYAAILGTGGNYAAVHQFAGWLRGLYRDILDRQATSNEVSNGVFKLDTAQNTLRSYAEFLLRNDEGRTAFVKEQVRRLLGREADSALISQFKNYSIREDAIVGIASSPEYFSHNGGNNDSFVRAVYRDLMDINPAPAGDVGSWVQRLNSGTSRTDFLRTIVRSDQYLRTLVKSYYFRYTLDEAQGVIPSSTNPDPNGINFYVGRLKSGATSESVLLDFFTSTRGAQYHKYAYLDNAAYYRGFWCRRGVRISEPSLRHAQECQIYNPVRYL